MSKKKKPSRNEALNELKTLESKWLKDHRIDDVSPIQAKVAAAKVAALLELIENDHLSVDVGMWPLSGAEDLVKMDENAFKTGLKNLQSAGVLNASYKFRKVAKGAASGHTPNAADFAAEGGVLTYRCVKPGGVSLQDRDEYIQEDQEVGYSEDDIAQSADLQHAIANEWLMRVES